MEIDSLVVKVASRCNLNCTYCYVYNKGNQSYLKQPKIMTLKTIKALLISVLNHCEKKKLKKFLIVFHGGEPLLTGIKFYESFINLYENIFENKKIKIDFALQTNGVLLNEINVEIFKKLKIQIGVSLDGTIASNNLNRIYYNGKGSYNDILAGFNLI